VSRFDAFGVFWCIGVALIGCVNVAWGINDLKRGSARMSWYGNRVDRGEEPFEFWLAVGSKLAALPFCGFMLWFGSGIFGK
jgi:hypothetical protein